VTADEERRRAGQVAEAVVRSAAAAGMTIDDDLAVWALADGVPSDRGRGIRDAAPVDHLAAVLERATDPGRRRSQGLHVTPPWLADRLMALALPDVAVDPPAPSGSAPAARRDMAAAGGGPPTVCDPACGGGAFLVAAARRLHELGVPRRDVVRRLVWGADIDAVGVATAEAALWLWAGERPPPGRLVVADPLLDGGASWPDGPPAFAAVVGNPPFQSQLGRATVRSARDRARLRARYGPAVRAYTDTAWLFLLAACDLARPGGRIVMVQPQSVVAARDADEVRRAVDERAVLHGLWLDDGRVFDAAVRVCAPVLERRSSPATTEPAGARPDSAGGSAEGASPTTTHRDGDGTWGRLWSSALGVPDVDVDLHAGPTLGERATVVAGFRDQYYGLVPVVRERRPSDADDGVAPLITSGVLDWAACAWGERPVRYAKRRWRAPVVDLDRLATEAPPVAQRWVARTRAPKLVVATQTRVVEAAVDVGGTWVPSVPTIAVVPTDPDDLWRLAAAVLSPAATAWLVRRSAGTGLDRGALKVAGPDLVALPLPSNGAAWDAAATALRALVAETRRRDEARRTDATGPPEAMRRPAETRPPGPTHPPDLLAAYLDAAAAAYGVARGVADWWRRQARVSGDPGPAADGPAEAAGGTAVRAGRSGG
jgi:hypothetical protein